MSDCSGKAVIVQSVILVNTTAPSPPFQPQRMSRAPNDANPTISDSNSHVYGVQCHTALLGWMECRGDTNLSTCQPAWYESATSPTGQYARRPSCGDRCSGQCHGHSPTPSAMPTPDSCILSRSRWADQLKTGALGRSSYQTESPMYLDDGRDADDIRVPERLAKLAAAPSFYRDSGPGRSPEPRMVETVDCARGASGASHRVTTCSVRPTEVRRGASCSMLSK
ncbi:uncharacterized protein N7459_002053 [Penicillium hispanicum]|uniref:uncharacterized protein n=1 Tax=Penicillium hispanicum TaxID=1080232 RepID=UPI0025424CF5|nr:uncharacterized protein N7459_002053 [Penicillium hispanicum]KAJ5591684.1 hypothetical protein N7459_002053 [Penicillium hispanicum]